jgi:hypothetical protein
MENSHFKVLKTVKHKVQLEVGNNPYNFGRNFVNKDLLNPLINKKFSRDEIFSLVENQNVDTLNIIIVILSWGGIKATKYQKDLFKHKEWIETCERIRFKKILSRTEAFQIFQDLRKQNKMPGLDVAFFTKLICFLNRDLKGYIMDQWTSKSINLLFEPFIKISKYGQVQGSNSSGVYEKFCNYIEDISDLLNTSPIHAEEMIFSNGGKNKGEWRSYVINQTWV